MNFTAFVTCYFLAFNEIEKPEENHLASQLSLPIDRCEVMELEIEGFDLNKETLSKNLNLPEKMILTAKKLLSQPTITVSGIPEEAIMWLSLNVTVYTKGNPFAFTPEISMSYEVDRIINDNGIFLAEISSFDPSETNVFLMIYVERIYGVYILYIRRVIKYM